MKKYVIYLYFLIMCIVTLNYSLAADCAINHGWAPWVSIYELKAHPDKYDGKYVRLEGWFSFMLEDNSIYNSKEDFMHHRVGNRIAISAYKSNNVEDINIVHAKFVPLNNKSVILIGCYKYRPKERIDFHWIVNIEKISEVPVRQDLESHKLTIDNDQRSQ